MKKKQKRFEKIKNAFDQGYLVLDRSFHLGKQQCNTIDDKHSDDLVEFSPQNSRNTELFSNQALVVQHSLCSSNTVNTVTPIDTKRIHDTSTQSKVSSHPFLKIPSLIKNKVKITDDSIIKVKPRKETLTEIQDPEAILRDARTQNFYAALQSEYVNYFKQKEQAKAVTKKSFKELVKQETPMVASLQAKNIEYLRLKRKIMSKHRILPSLKE